jgi:hypothetical protein
MKSNNGSELASHHRIVVVANMKMVDTQTYFLQLRRGDEEHWLRADMAEDERTLAGLLRRKFGIVGKEAKDTARIVLHEAETAHQRRGIARAGWIRGQSAFSYPPQVFRARGSATAPQFIAPRGTLIADALEAFTCRGDKATQLRVFRRLWSSSRPFRFLLSLVCGAPFIEVIGASPAVVVLAGSPAILLTSLLQFAISGLYDPRARAISPDVRKGGRGSYRQLVLCHNFPIHIQAAAARPAKEVNQFIRMFLDHRIEGPLPEAEQGLLPEEAIVTSVCLLDSGEGDLVLDEDTRKRVVRIDLGRLEIDDTRPHDLRHCLNSTAWLGRKVIKRTLRRERFRDDELRPLGALYDRYRAEVASENNQLDSHAVNVLAVAAVGYGLVRPILFKRSKSPDKLYQGGVTLARRMMSAMMTEPNSPQKALQRVLRAITKIPGIRGWILRGFLPVRLMKKVASKTGMRKSQDVLKGLKTAGIAEKSESRRTDIGNERCYILTAKGRRLLRAAVQN